MLTARAVIARGHWDAGSACDTITLDHDARHRRRFRYVASGGTEFLLDLPRAEVLADGDGLTLDDGRIVAVAAAAEPIMEVRAGSAQALLRLAWHIGNRHLPAEIGAEAIRLRQDHVIRAMLEGLGADVRALHAAFTPEQGAYSGGGHHHGHEHGHEHEHGHAH